MSSLLILMFFFCTEWAAGA